MAAILTDVTGIRREPGASLHHQLSVVLREAIESGRYGSGDYLPGETSLMATFEVSRATVRRALSTLEAERLVDRQPGKGTRVRQRATTKLATPITRHLRLIERGSAGTSVDVREFDYVLPPHDAARALQLADGVRALKITRVRRRGDVPLRYLTSFVDPAIGEGLSRLDLEKFTLPEALRRSGHGVERAEDEVGATLADPATAAALGVRIGDPLLEMARAMFDLHARPLAFQWTLVSPRRFRLRVVISGDGQQSLSPLGDYGVFEPLTSDHGLAPPP